MRLELWQLDTDDASNGDGLVYDQPVDEWVPGAVVRTIASSDGSVTVDDTDPRHIDLAVPPPSDTFREVLMASGTSFPADPLESSSGGDWLYGEALS